MIDIVNFAKNLNGRIIVPGDSDYDKVRQIFYGGIDKKPKAIVRVAGAQDIQKTIAFAKENNLDLAVRSGGHSVMGLCTVDDGVVVDLRDMKRIEINDQDKTAWAQTGLTAGEVTTELDKHNLVLGFGDTGSVGIGGITLGGGIGFVVRKFGLTIDNLLAAEIVTADGRILQTDKDNYPDLFWAIRGGGGNFGVVTKFKYKLHDLSECYGGVMLLPAKPDVIAGLIQISQKAPDELSIIINIMPTPPMPFVPAAQQGKLSVMAMIMYAGDPKEGEKVLVPIRALATPIADMVKPMRYKDIYFPENENYHPTAVSRNLYMKFIDIDLAEKIIDHLNSINAQMKAIQIRILGGALSRVPVESTAYSHRGNNIMINMASFYTTEREKEEQQKWQDEFLQVLDQGDPAIYVNFLGPYEKEKIKNIYTEKTWNRLITIKKKYDPSNFFHNCINISE
jgi:FAD/FMN-containing dehydrogenase